VKDVLFARNSRAIWLFRPAKFPPNPPPTCSDVSPMLGSLVDFTADALVGHEFLEFPA
jgi:hypothetical protein